MIKCHYLFWVHILLFTVLLLLGFSGSYVSTKPSPLNVELKSVVCQIHQETVLVLLKKEARKPVSVACGYNITEQCMKNS